jgi:hypothetical protein
MEGVSNNVENLELGGGGGNAVTVPGSQQKRRKSLTPADTGFFNFQRSNDRLPPSLPSSVDKLFPDVWSMPEEDAVKAMNEIVALYDPCLEVVSNLLTSDVFPRFKNTDAYRKMKLSIKKAKVEEGAKSVFRLAFGGSGKTAAATSTAAADSAKVSPAIVPAIVPPGHGSALSTPCGRGPVMV